MKVKSAHVPDDWDDDDDEEETDSQKIWETAYATLPRPTLSLPSSRMGILES